VGLGALAVVAAVAGVRLLGTRPGPAAAGVTASPGAPSPALLDPARWSKCEEGDFEESSIGLAGSREDGGERLKVRAATRGTRDDTVKFLGVRSVPAFGLIPGARISARLDWNHQANGCYLSQAIILSPQSTKGNPLLGPDWFKVEYIGVPPGENARLLIACRTQGRERFLFTEGWPDANRKGRKIDLQGIEIVVLPAGVQVLENGATVFESKEKLLPTALSHLYLQVSTHSNYPPRELFFDRIRFPEGP
jgi:hypothetical protein